MDWNNIVNYIKKCNTEEVNERKYKLMSISLPVQVTKEHLSKYKNCSPSLALSEFIWNSLDADAFNINISFSKTDLEIIESIIINDDGHGINYDELNDTFGKFGSTYKKYRIKSPKGRYYHGKQGHGRYKGFSLGNQIIWESCYFDNQENLICKFEICGNNSDLDKYIISEREKSEMFIQGTKTTISLINSEFVNIDPSKIANELELIFAPYLLAYPGINIVVDNHRLDPKNSMTNMETNHIFVEASKNDKEIMAELKIIEWKNGKSKNKYLCNSHGIALAEEPSGIKATMFSHTVYVISEFFDYLEEENKIDLREHFPNYVKLNNEVDKIIRKYYRKILAKSAESVIQELKREGVYPYKESANTDVEIVEREVFDICAANVHQYLAGFKGAAKTTKSFTLSLLKEALNQNPSSMKRILNEILKLPTEKVDELAELLEKTNLSAMITLTKMITDRLAFINGLEQILNEPFFNKKLKERSQLQKILLRELWIFGEEYTYGCDDVTLKNVLLQHINILGRNELTNNIPEEDLKDLTDIPDICLYRQYTSGRPDEYENLVVELKRPSVKLGLDELSQIRRYASTVSKTKYFDKEKTKWVFVIIGTELNDDAKSECNQTDRAYGLITRGDKYEVWVKEWNQIIQEAKGRHEFMKKKLDYNLVDNSEGKNYLLKNYGEFIPKEE